MKNIKYILIILFIILWMFTIYKFSAMTSNESNNISKNIIIVAIKNTLNITNKIGITNKYPSDEAINKYVKKWNGPLRKFAHASVYLILANILMLLIVQFKTNKIYLYNIFSIIFCFGFACSDEYHQLFVSGRTGQVMDILIDTLGASIGCIIFDIIYNLCKKCRKLEYEID